MRDYFKGSLFVLSILTFILCGMNSCRKDICWSDTQPINGQEWSILNPVTFNLDPMAYHSPYKDDFERKTAEAIGDTIPRLHGRYEAVVSLRYSGNCTTSSLDVVVERMALQGEITCDTLRFELFDPANRPEGRGRFSIYEVSQKLPPPYTALPGAIISLYPVEYSEPVKGIRSATLILSRE